MTHASFRAAIGALDVQWPDSPEAEAAEAHLQTVAEELDGLVSHDVPVAAIAAGAVCFGIVDADGRIVRADASFAARFGEDAGSPALTGLMVRARGNDVAAVGLVMDQHGDPVAVCIAPPARTPAWPIPAQFREAASVPGRWVVMAFAPMASAHAATAAARAFGLSQLETRVAFAMIEAPSLKIAAERLEIGRETARDALAGAMRKLGVRRTALLVRRLTEFTCNLGVADDAATLTSALRVSPAEARVARLTAQGATAADVAATLSITRETVKAHLRSIFGKLGLGRAKDLGRLSAEVAALATISQAAELVVPTEGDPGRLRVIARPHGRRVAFIDYGPAHGRPLVCCHALASGRTLPRRLRIALHRAGFRPIVPQRPGYGLTDADDGDYLATAAEDMAAILDALHCDRADLFARDIAAAPALAFAERFPGRIAHGLLLNPQAPAHDGRRRFAISVASGLLQRHPELAHPLFELLRRQLSASRLTALLHASFKAGVASDTQALHDPETLNWMIADVQAMVARTTAGVIRERLVYAGGWHPPRQVGGARWTVAHCAELGDRDWQRWWRALPNVAFSTLAQGGLLLPVTHPHMLVELLVR